MGGNMSPEAQSFQDAKFRAAWNKAGRSVTRYAEQNNTVTSSVYKRRNAVLARNPEWFDLLTIGRDEVPAWPEPRVTHIEMRNKVALAGSDLHCWPGAPPVMWHAFCAVAYQINPDEIWLVGDVIDGARVSRHAKSPGITAPKLQEEINAAQERLGWLPAAKKRWLRGNHDIRFEAYMAQNAPEMEHYAGTLPDQFPDWEFSWSLMINKDVCEVRHRYHGGIHAAYNNVLKTGCSIITGDTHALDCRPLQDRRGVRWGVQLGMLADPDHPMFFYNEGKTSQHRRGFAVLSFDQDGMLKPPELCEWADGRAWFRGKAVADVKGPRVRVKAGRAA